MNFLRFLKTSISALPNAIVNGSVYFKKSTKALSFDLDGQRYRVNPPADWNETDTESPAYIANKPSVGTVAAFDIAEDLDDSEGIPNAGQVSEAIGIVKAQVTNMVGTPCKSSTKENMVDPSKIYVYTGNEQGMIFGNWYYFDDVRLDWVNGGVYNSVAVQTDTSLTSSGIAADGKAVGDRLGVLEDSMDDDISDIRNDLNYNKTVTPGYLLRATNAGRGLEWSPFGLPTDEQTENAITGWLNDHPEATTTVQDRSLTYKKFAEGTLAYVTPEMFGAYGNGDNDDTVALQTALQYHFVFIPNKTYKVKEPIVATSKKIICANGATLLYDGNTGSVLTLSSTSVEVCNLTIDGNNKAIKGISVPSGSTYSDSIIINGCRCRNFNNNKLRASSAGIYVLAKSKHTEIKGCIVENVYRTTGKAGAIASVGIGVLAIDGTCEISNNIINGIYFDEEVKTDADGIQAFEYNATTQDAKSTSTTISNNVITQCQGRFIKCQTQNIIVNNNTCVNNGLELINNFRGIDLQIGKGIITGNHVSVSGRATDNIATSAIISWTSRNYTPGYAQLIAKDNDLVNDVQGGYGFILIPYDMAATINISDNNIKNFVFGIEVANTTEINNKISLIICQNWFNNVYYGHRIRTPSSGISEIIKNNSGYVYDNKVEAVNNQSFAITAETIKEFFKLTYLNYKNVGNYMCHSTWKSHSTFACIISVITTTYGSGLFFSGGYIYVYLISGDVDYLYTFNNTNVS